MPIGITVMRDAGMARPVDDVVRQFRTPAMSDGSVNKGRSAVCGTRPNDRDG